MGEFIGVQETRYLMNAMEKNYSELVKELQRQLPINKIAETLQRLVSERVSIRDLRLIFGTLIDWAPREKDVLMLTEYVRIALRRHILRRLNPEGKPLPILRIGEGIENLVRESIRQTAMGTYTALSSRHKTQILQLIEQALKQSAYPSLNKNVVFTQRYRVSGGYLDGVECEVCESGGLIQLRINVPHHEIYMLRIANEERPWMEMLPTQGATIGELTLSMQQYPVQQGTLFTINYHNELGRVWIAEQCWQRWCEGLIGTANRSAIDPELLYGIAEWGVAPLLQASDATLCQNKWTVEEHEFHSIIFTWPTGFLRNIVGELSAERQQIYPAPPVVVPVYLGWCQLTLLSYFKYTAGYGNDDGVANDHFITV